MHLRHIRNGVELEPIVDENNYDFNYQQARWIDPPRRVFRGDILLGECSFQGRPNNVTFGGYATSDEMCTFYISYAPKVQSKPRLYPNALTTQSDTPGREAEGSLLHRQLLHEY